MSIVIQVFGSGLICGLCFCLGVTFAWPSSTLRLFESANTTLHRPMTETELALFGSLSAIGALIGTPAVGLLLDRLGRKNCSIIFSVLSVLSWALIAMCNRVEVLLTAVFISGLSAATFLIVPVYIGEICKESIRGTMTSCSVVMYGVGVLASYWLGGALEYHTMVYLCLGICAVLTAALFMLKESPTYLMLKGMEEEAVKTLAFYRRLKPGSIEMTHELNVIRRSLNPDLDESPETQNLKMGENNVQELSFWQFMKKSKSSRQAFMITMFLTTASVFEGPYILQVYAQPMFVEAIPSMSANLASILLGLCGIVAGLVAAYLTDRAGRRPLMIYSSFLTAVTCVALGLQLHLHWGPPWLVAVNIYLFTAMFACGAGSIPPVLMGEVFLPQVKSILSIFLLEWTWLCSFIILFIFNPLMKQVGIGPIFYIFGSVALVTGVFCILVLPETKGLTVDEIQLRLVKKPYKKCDAY